MVNYLVSKLSSFEITIITLTRFMINESKIFFKLKNNSKMLNYSLLFLNIITKLRKIKSKSRQTQMLILTLSYFRISILSDAIVDNF